MIEQTALPANRWQHLYYITNYGTAIQPRGEPTKEILFVQSAITEPFDWHVERKLNLDYVRREFQWYLNGDDSDLRICEHAKIWRGMVNRDQTLSSNYGWYLFTQKQLEKAVNILKADEMSRRAVMSIYNMPKHTRPGVKDVPCTTSISFFIRGRRLHMGVHMRSNDLVFGLGNDAPCFHWFHCMAYLLLKEKYDLLQMGDYVHRADSLHIYERHFQLATRIGTGKGTWKPQDVPKMQTAKEVRALMAGERPKTPFGKWLYEVEL